MPLHFCGLQKSFAEECYTEKDSHCLLSIDIYVGHNFSSEINFNDHLLTAVVDYLHHVPELRNIKGKSMYIIHQ